ncbi:XRE family transcriptional regulator [Micromonospora sp. KC723]|uniref:XRE family transcriptional regulator n=1 Tax=Micromonospora sp. KC723 TaxID=2530381 RepID=UPI00104D0FB6|nr:XRE family transcriptional regulator [Micromonospora sp. KC723]TDB78459.1 XRE family transcriptional regulator [Micromonospora sp. KC723]
MGRPERPVDPAGGPIAAFALDLRRLREQAGNPSYRKLSGRANFSPSVLSAAASGFSLPTLQVTLALVEACGGDREEWARRWREVAGWERRSRSRQRRTPEAFAVGEDIASEHRRVAEAAPLIPAQLPVGPRHFAGRGAELARLSGFVLGGGNRTPLMISGPVGVGKSALAIRWGQQHGAHFRDGVLYADLSQQIDARDIVTHFLQTLGCHRDQINTSEQHRSALYRSLLADRRVLVLLDNAVDEAQVRPLLAGSSGSQVLVTSRDRLAGLDGVERLALDALPLDQSLTLIGAVVGPEQVAAEYEAACQLAELCDHLPLALWTAAGCVAMRPGWSLGYAVEQLRDRSRRLAQFDCGEMALGRRLRDTYATLDPLPASAWRVISATQGCEPDAKTLASRMRLSWHGAEELLESLVDVGLLIGTPVPGSYRMPVLFRLFAADMAAQQTFPLHFGPTPMVARAG